MAIKKGIIFIFSLLALLVGNVQAQGLVIDTQQSELRILVYRAGLLGDMGHNHVIHTRSLSGSVDYDQADITQSKVELTFAIDSLVIDDAELRDQEGEDFPGAVPEKDITGTRKNMDTKVLHTEKFPQIAARSVKIDGEMPDLLMTMAIDIHGDTQTLVVPVTVTEDAGSLRVVGQVDVMQSALGVTPLKILFGTIAVQDEITIKLDILAR